VGGFFTNNFNFTFNIKNFECFHDNVDFLTNENNLWKEFLFCTRAITKADLYK